MFLWGLRAYWEGRALRSCFHSCSKEPDEKHKHDFLASSIRSVRGHELQICTPLKWFQDALSPWLFLCRASRFQLIIVRGREVNMDLAAQRNILLGKLRLSCSYLLYLQLSIPWACSRLTGKSALYDGRVANRLTAGLGIHFWVHVDALHASKVTILLLLSLDPANYSQVGKLFAHQCMQ